MSCCGNHNQHDSHTNHYKKGPANHLMMMICCILPIVLFVILIIFNNVSGSTSNMLTYSVLLLCPLSHLVLMPLMMRNKKH